MVLCVVFFSSCSEGKPNENEQDNQSSEPLNEEKCVNFAEKLHHSFADSSVSYMDAYLSWEIIENAVVKEDPLRKEIFDTLVHQYNISQEFIQLTYSGADVRFITYYKEEDKHYLIFRVFEQPQNLNIYEFELQGDASEIAITDIYDFSTASGIQSSMEAEVDFWSLYKNEWVQHFQTFRNLEHSFNSLMMEGKLKEAFLLTKDYADEFQDLKRFRQLYGLICENANSPQLMIGYLDDEVGRIPLTEKGRWLPLFYLRSLEGNFGEALIALSNLEKEIGQDVFIDFLKGNIYFEMGDYEAAINWFNKALSQNNQVMIFYLGKVHSYINMKKYVEAVETLLVMDDSFDIDELDWSTEFAQYPDFVKSEEFKQFLNRLD